MINVQKQNDNVRVCQMCNRATEDLKYCCRFCGVLAHLSPERYAIIVEFDYGFNNTINGCLFILGCKECMNSDKFFRTLTCKN